MINSKQIQDKIGRLPRINGYKRGVSFGEIIPGLEARQIDPISVALREGKTNEQQKIAKSIEVMKKLLGEENV
jgi:hypothetical protein